MSKQLKTDTDYIDNAILFACSQSEFNLANYAIVVRRCAIKNIRPEKIREYLAYRQSKNELQTIIVGSDLFINLLNN